MAKHFFIFSMIAIVLSQISFAASPAYVWPTQTWPTSLPQKVGFETEAFERFLSYTFPDEQYQDGRDGIRTEGLLVIKDGLLVYEKYLKGWSPEKRHITWSMSKLLTNALVGVAVRENILQLSDLVSHYFPERKDPEFLKLRVQDLFEWSSGFDWNETYEYNPFVSSVVAMLYSLGRKDMSNFVLGFPFQESPGKDFRYSSGDTNLLMAVLRQALGQKRYEDFPWTEIFGPLGMSSSVWERDGTGLFVGSSYWHSTARDIAKLGLLFMNDGVWNQRRILPEGWVFQSSQVVHAFHQTERRLRAQSLSPGRHLWLNQEIKDRGIQKVLPDVPSDLIAGLGHWGQGLYILPSLRMIVVRLADDRQELAFDQNQFLRLLIEALGPQVTSVENAGTVK